MMRGRLAARVLATILLAGIAHPASATERGNPAEALADPGDQGSTRTLYLSLIRQARVDGRSRAALAYLDDFDRQYPRDREALVLRINCLLDLGQTDEARTALKRIPPNDRDGQVLEIRGHVSAALGDWAQAARDYGAALDASPANPLVGNALGYARLRSGQPQQAVEALKAAHDLAPNETVIRNNLALALTVAGRGAEAEALLSAVRDVRSRGEIRSQIASEAARLAVPAAAGAGNETGGDHG